LLPSLVEFAQFFAGIIIVWFFLLAALVIYRATSGLSGIVDMLRPEERGGALDPERVQLFVIFLGALLIYARGALGMMDGSEVVKLPEVPEELIAVLTGSNALYLGGKIVRSEKKGN